MSTAEACQLAQNLARNCGYSVFPCKADKSPATPHGFKDASRDPDAIAELWRRFPGPLIGIAAGEPSGISVLDIDIKHSSACTWWHANERLLPPTRACRTRSGGLHLYFQHEPGIRNASGRPVPGVDVRGDGGYVISWFAASLECLDHSPPAPFPGWLRMAIWAPPKPEPRQRSTTPSNPDAVVQRAIRFVAAAPEGRKHDDLRRAARLLGGIQHAAGFSDADAIKWLKDALPATVQDWNSAEATISWGLQSGRAKPIEHLGGAR
jgi:hypothetical protein